MLNIKTIIILLLLLMPNGSVFSQKANLANDFQFFLQKKSEYEGWLDKTGLGKYIKIELLRMKPVYNENNIQIGIDSTELEMFLLLETTDPDSAIAMWKSLKKVFDVPPEDSLESLLYRMFVHKMEIPGLQGNIQIYIRDKGGSHNRCFYIYIWEEPEPKYKAKIFTEYNFNECRSKTFDIAIRTPVLNITRGRETTRLAKITSQTPDQIFSIIRGHMINSVINQARYRTSECNDRVPRFENDSIRTDYSYRFTLANLCKEVLTDQRRHSLEKILGFNFVAMERLTFQFDYYPIQDGFLLKCVIDGKYGSGFFKPRTKGYLNMENEFEDYFETYKHHIRQEIESKLKDYAYKKRN